MRWFCIKGSWVERRACSNMKKTNFSCVCPILKSLLQCHLSASACISMAQTKLHRYSWLQRHSEKVVILCRYFAFQIRITALLIRRIGSMGTSWTPSRICYSTTHPWNILASSLLIALPHSTVPLLLVSPPSLTPQCFDQSKTIVLDSSLTTWCCPTIPISPFSACWYPPYLLSLHSKDIYVVKLP